MTETSKVVHTELKGILSNRFEIIKSFLGIQNDAEVVRFLIQNYYTQKLEEQENKAKKEVEQDQVTIQKFMDKYGPEWKKLGE
jgi:hypothetical protein